MGDSRIGTGIGYGCLVVILGGVGYCVIKEPITSLVFGVIIGGIFVLILAWHGLLWAIRSTRKGVKTIIATILLLCGTFLVPICIFFIIQGMRNLYKRELTVFIITVVCAGILITYGAAILTVKDEDRDKTP